jgi:hypothetical protein
VRNALVMGAERARGDRCPPVRVEIAYAGARSTLVPLPPSIVRSFALDGERFRPADWHAMRLTERGLKD